MFSSSHTPGAGASDATTSGVAVTAGTVAAGERAIAAAGAGCATTAGLEAAALGSAAVAITATATAPADAATGGGAAIAARGVGRTAMEDLGAAFAGANQKVP